MTGLVHDPVGVSALPLGGLGGWPARRWVVAALVTVVAALVIGIPTGVVPSSLYQRMTPVLWWNYPVWAISSLLVGLTAATYVASPTAVPVEAARSGRWARR